MNEMNERGLRPSSSVIQSVAMEYSCIRCRSDNSTDCLLNVKGTPFIENCFGRCRILLVHGSFCSSGDVVASSAAIELEIIWELSVEPSSHEFSLQFDGVWKHEDI
jgi:hypothetical protein